MRAFWYMLSSLSMKPSIFFFFLLQRFCSYWRCQLTPRMERNMWPMPRGLDSRSFFFVFRFVLGDKCNQELLLTRIGSSFNLFGVVLFAFWFNLFTSSCNASICFSNFLFCLRSTFFFVEVTGSAFFSFFEILTQYFCFFNLSFSLFILTNSSFCCLFNQSSAYSASSWFCQAPSPSCVGHPFHRHLKFSVFSFSLHLT